jgi:hypothetical protein
MNNNRIVPRIIALPRKGQNGCSIFETFTDIGQHSTDVLLCQEKDKPG